ncbi:MAG: DNA-directed RNA polymerase subunit beta [Rickettsiales bacterium]|nr:DNA-directed RNA polymerase subunit beta [Rickettsiales bacterium]
MGDDSLFVRNISRKSFGKIPRVASIPNLIDLQKLSFEKFLQLDVLPDQRKNVGLQSVFNSIFPINDYEEKATLEFVSYKFDKPKYDVEESKQRGITYAASLNAVLRLVIWDVDPDTNAKEVSGIKEQEVFFGNIPFMTEYATFVINGVERVIVSQMHRSPGVFFDHDKGKTHSSGKYLYFARVIPYRGSWLDLEFDVKGLLYFRIDRRRKLLAPTLLRALGLSSQDMYDFYYDKIKFSKTSKGWVTDFNFNEGKVLRLSKDLVDADTDKVVATAGTRLSRRLANELKQKGLKRVLFTSKDLVGKFIATDLKISDEEKLESGDELTVEVLDKIDSLGVKDIHVLDVDNYNVGSSIRNSIKADKNKTEEDALMDIFRVLRPGEPVTFEAAKAMFDGIFFDSTKYDLLDVGRVKLNARLNLDLPEKTTVLTKEDILHIIKCLVKLKDTAGEVDDIDSLANRRIRPVGELLENQLRVAFVRLQKNVLEKISVSEIETIMPTDLINSKIILNLVKEFFGLFQLSQFMDQTNPLSEVTHKRRISALGPGGLTRDRAGIEVRDVHTTHYGRICPIETPEGQNIGLINSLASYAKVNKYGFIESPYRKVTKGKATNEIIYLSAMEESKYIIAQTGANISEDGQFKDALVNCRKNGNFVIVSPSEINFMDVAPMQIVSIATSLIPFLENDDAKRALMGSNMQRQAVPLLSVEAPFVGTGIEKVVAKDSGAVVTASHDGVIDKIDSSRIVLKYDAGKDGSPGVDIYNLHKFQKSNHSTCINQRPLVKVGDRVRRNDVIADGPSTDRGDLALGRNVLVAFVPWQGYNFEDAILVSENLVREDKFTSLHIEEFSVLARDTRLGPEEITRDIPNVSEEALTQLDEAGIARIGAKVKAGDILVGKVTPKSETPMTPEEKLLQAIFGEKAADVKESSLYVPPGVSATVVEVRVFSRRGIEKDQRALALERSYVQKLTKDRDDEASIIEKFVYTSLRSMLIGKKAKSGPKGFKASVLTKEILEDYKRSQLWDFVIEDQALIKKISVLKEKYDLSMKSIDKKYAEKIEKTQKGDDLPQGVLREVKVFVAMKYKLQPGDKMAGRHGNKGVISKIVPQEDMPYLEDGTPVDMVLNPLGIPPRMNVGQLLETHLGWASKNLAKKISRMVKQHQDGDKISSLKKFLLDLYPKGAVFDLINKAKDEDLVKLSSKLAKGVYFSTPVFDGAKIEDLDKMFELSEVDKSGQVNLIDGRTGNYFARKVTVGYIYMMKLHHLVNDKIHARSVGPYSLVTQQPLGGKSHFGGQRFGEMECWAMQGYGAAYNLQEMLTVKSDDVVGRVKMFESIVRGDDSFECGIPESFNVMIKELRSLVLNVELKTSE